MTRRSRLFIGIFVVYLAAVGLLLYRIAADLDPRYRESAEESLVDTANLLATLLERRAYNGVIPVDDLDRTLAELTARPIYARIYGIEKTAVALHVYVTDHNGIVLFDSRGQDVGADYLPWRDVQLTLEGSYGARTTRSDPADARTEVMYVGAAIRERREGARAETGEDIIGMVAVGKPVQEFSPFIINARHKLILFGAISAVAFALATLAATMWLARPFGLLRDLWHGWHAARAGGFAARWRGVWHAVRTALANMRDGMAGQSYIDEYVATLTHELKSPLAAIRGAAELLREPMAADAHARFVRNIEEQTRRAQDLVDRLLELSSLERRGALERIEPVILAAIARAVTDELAPLAAAKDISLELAVDAAHIVAGDPFLLQRAVSNLVHNAIEFAPAHSTVTITSGVKANTVELKVRDRGAGLPEFARARVFERFFSLPRPDTGKKSTGLGLALVKEVATLHGGRVTLANCDDGGGGAMATIQLPRAQRPE